MWRDAPSDAQVAFALFCTHSNEVKVKFLQQTFLRKFGSEVDWEALKAGGGFQTSKQTPLLVAVSGQGGKKADELV